jgi:hypothetical protein
MKNILRHSIAALTLSAIISSSVFAGSSSLGQVDFGKFRPTAGEQFVQVDINGTLLKLAAAFTKNEEPEISELIRNLQSVRVNVLGINDENREETTTRINEIRADLDTQGWTRVVTVLEGKGDDVAVFIRAANDTEIHGIVVSVISHSGEAVLVNIVGNVGIDQIAKIGEKLNIDPLRELNFKRPVKS